MSASSVMTAQRQTSERTNNSFHQQQGAFQRASAAATSSSTASTETENESQSAPAMQGGGTFTTSREQEGSSNNSTVGYSTKERRYGLQELSNESREGNKKHQFQCLFTKHKTQKRKNWQDGRLVVDGIRASVYTADPAPGSGDPVLDGCELTTTQRQALIQGTETRVETDMFLIQVEGVWINKPISEINNNNTATNGFSKSVQKLIQRKFQKPGVYVPPRRSEATPLQQNRLENILGKRRRPLQPGELERRHYGVGLPRTQDQPQQHGQLPTTNPRDGMSVSATGRFTNTTRSWSPQQQESRESLRLPAQHQHQQQSDELPSEQRLSNSVDSTDHRGYAHMPQPDSFRVGREGQSHEASNEQSLSAPGATMEHHQRPYSSAGLEGHYSMPPQQQQQQQQYDYNRPTTMRADMLNSNDHPSPNPASANSFVSPPPLFHHQQQQPQQEQLAASRNNGFVKSSGEFNASSFYGIEEDCTQNDDFEEAGGMEKSERNDAPSPWVPFGAAAENTNPWNNSDFSTNLNPQMENHPRPAGFKGIEAAIPGPSPSPPGASRSLKQQTTAAGDATSSALTGSQLLALFGAAPAQPQEQHTQETEVFPGPAEKQGEQPTLEFILPSQSSDSSSDESDH